MGSGWLLGGTILKDVHFLFGTLWKSVAYRKPFNNERSERPVQTARWEGGPDGLDMVPSLHPTPPLFVYWKFGPCVSYIIKATLGSIFLGKELRQEHAWKQKEMVWY